MTPKCASIVRQAAAGRQISDAKLQALDDAVASKMRELARRDTPRWLGLTRDQRYAEAATEVMTDIQAAAALKTYRAGLQVLRAAERDEAIGRQQAIDPKASRSVALARDIENTANEQHAIRDRAIGLLGDLLDAVASKDGTGALRNLAMRVFQVDNPQMTADIVREVFKNADGHTGNVAARKAAQAWLEVIEQMRQRFNKAGGDIGKLGYGYLSQAHDYLAVLRATADGWSAKVLPLLDRKQYVRPDGVQMGDAEVLDLLRAAWKTIASQGDNKTEPGQFKGPGARANRGSDHRVLHFNGGDAWMAYMREFGQGSLYDAMTGHIGKMASDIGLVEHWGPNPEQTYRVQADIAQRADGRGTWANRSAGNTPDAYWALVTGKTNAPENPFVARVGSDLRNVQTAAKLGGAVLSAVSDAGTIAAALHFNRLPYFDMLANIGRQFSSEQRAMLQAHGIIAEHLASSMNRFTGDHLTHGLTGKIAQATMRLTGMNAWTDGLRGAFSATMMQNFAKKIGKGWDSLTQWDRYLMERKGITQADWDVISRAAPTEHNGLKYLTAQAIEATGAEGAAQTATKWLAFVSDEAQFAVVNPDLATRAIVTAGGVPTGKLAGEAIRSIMQFKSFPAAMITRHWRRMLQTPQGLEGAPLGYGAQTAAGATVNRVALLAGLNVSMTMLGAIALQIKALIQGKDPYDMTEGKFWARSFAQGGGSGFIGDLLTKDPTEPHYGQTGQVVGSVLGPVAGETVSLAYDLMWRNAWEAAKGKDTKAAAEALRWLNAQAPGVNMWWTRGAWDHWVMHNMQEAVNPGYLARMQQRAQRDWGQGYWWVPGEALPGPGVARITGD